MRSRRMLPTALAWSLLLFAAPAWANGINPHLDNDSCLACHTKVPSGFEARSGLSFLIRDSIDETCGLCHQLLVDQSRHTLSGHPIGIKLATSMSTTLSLPLSDGYLTCKTCHLCLASETGPSFALLRISNNGLAPEEARSELCRECHKGY